ncbi:MAG TPA: S8 family peptidase, partial [Ilumatobacteraceae bacterium]|nr:S8 family peptidase [Ilumatobacteraceae bacterium]
DGMSGRFDCAGHGTHVAGTIGSNTFGVAKAVTIVPIRVMNCQGKGFILSILAGIDWAVGQHGSGPAVLNASIGSDGLDPLWNDGVDWLIDDGITFVTSAGNDAANACSFNPGANPDAITVGSTDIDDELSSYSNTGSCVDVFAPGRQIRSTDFASSGSVTMSGTSMASPHVAGVAAIILGQHPTWTPADVGDVIVMTATPGVVNPPDDHPLNGAPNLLLRLHQDIGAPPNDTFVAASPFDIWGAPAEASTVWASKDAGEPSHAGDVGGASVWYRFTSAVSGSLELSTAGSDFDTLLAVYSGPGYGQLVGVGSGASTLTFSVAAGTTYRIVVDGDNRERGAVVLTPDFTPSNAPANDDLADAFALTGERSTISDSHSRLATHEVGEPAHAGSLGAGSVWWDVTVPVDGRLLVSTQGSSFDTVLGTYTGSAVNGLSPVASDDDTDGVQSQVWTPVTSGTDYHVAVDGASFSSTLGTGAVQLHTAVVDGDTGWYSPLASPVRLVDTRAGNVDALGTTDKTPLAPGQANVRRYVVTPIAGLAGASSVAINLTSVTQQGAGYLQLYPCAATTDAVPATSVLNFTPGAAIANNAIVGLIDNGFCVAAGGAASNIVIDAAGAYPDGLAYSALTDPARLVDTRPNTDALADPTDESTALGTNEVRRYVVPDAGDLPPAASIGAL